MTEVDERVEVGLEPLELPELGGVGEPPEELDDGGLPPDVLPLLLPLVTGASVGGPVGLLGPCRGVVVSFAVYDEH